MLLTAMLVVAGSGVVKGQDCIPKKRKYATNQKFYGQALLGLLLPGTISNDGNAVDNDLASYSTLTVDVGVLNQSQATQYLEFTSGTNYIPKNTPVTIKLSLPTSILGVLNNVSLQPFNNLNYYGGVLGVGARWQADPVGSPFTSSALVSLVNGVGELEFTVIPSDKYQGIWINVGSVLGVALSAQVYHAYIYEDDLTLQSCNSFIDVLSGVKPGLVGGILDATASVTNPRNAIDNFPLTTYAELNAGVQLVGEIFHTSVLKMPAQPGDAIEMIIEDPGGGLLNLSLLSGFTIQLYNGSTAVGLPISSSSTLLSLSLLPGALIGETKRKLLISPPTSYGKYDRVQVKVGGVATVGLVPGLRIYDVKKVIVPTFLLDGTLGSSKTICKGSTVQLKINDKQDCTTYNWYNSASGGTILLSGDTFTPLTSTLVSGTNIFYVEATRTNCTETSGRIPVTIILNEVTAGTISSDQSICLGSTPTLFTSTLATGIPTSTISYQWQKSTDNLTFSNITGATNATYAEPSAITQTTYYQRIAYSTINSKICEGISNKITVTVNNLPTITLGSNPLVCAGLSSTNLTYSATTNSPTTYSIIWNTAAHTSGFVDIQDATLTSTSIVLAVPTTASASTYLGTITVKNVSGCVSTINNFSLIVHPKVASPHLNITSN
ncbi:hypothetical protein [Pedobacter sp. MC2016-24]|uniref:immunoglobulin domain-containing protein n=1 Tax=Pedobacter sp. MC2016-24 TaxID=2780090 RepID=UPI001882E980|nr:hypothetical protein [Pedobacter sp. MC2016-24]MBE9600157.1 hypothetical protein [Pedobacter sp. MC2016-24]